ncbi:PBP1A family penicillin-binding protein [bacterium]|nr:PBP1A family penicillin-binding protein [bacterium]
MKEKLKALIDRLKLAKVPPLPKDFKLPPWKKSLAVGVGTIVALTGAKYLFHISFVHLPSLEEQGQGITIYDRENKEVLVIQEEGERKPVALDKVSQSLKDAVVAVEDRSFYKHLGVDPSGIARAAFTNIKERDLVEGGSTITQQLMKTMFFDFNDRTMRRKILEVVMAVDIEAGYPKERILETYLNQVYFGRGAWGIEQAAKIYFDKHARDLSLAESAFLAGLIKAPSSYGNPDHSKKAIERQHQVLKDMVECGYIDEAQAEAAKKQNLVFSKKSSTREYPFYITHVVGLLKEEFGEDKLFRKPISVYTNLDLDAQRTAEAEMNKALKKSYKGLDQGALVSIAIEDGAVIAIVGGAGSYERSQWNRALNPHTAGSTFKPFVYLAALATKKIGPSSVLYDERIKIPDPEGGKDYVPENYDRHFMGAITVRDALRLSRNACAVKVAVDTGLDKVADCAHKAGIISEIKEYPSMALGAAAVTPLELANAYATIARGGEWIEPRFIRSVMDDKGKLIKLFEQRRKNVLPEEPCLQVLDGMIDVVKEGTGRRAYLPGIEVAGKTGTADQRKDIWFVGMTPEVVTAVWAGNDENKPIKSSQVSGGTVTARIWAQYMTAYHSKSSKPQTKFKKPKTPLSRSLPFYAAIPKAIGETVDEFTRSLSEATEKVKFGKEIFDDVTKQLQKILPGQ